MPLLRRNLPLVAPGLLLPLCWVAVNPVMAGLVPSSNSSSFGFFASDERGSLKERQVCHAGHARGVCAYSPVPWLGKIDCAIAYTGSDRSSSPAAARRASDVAGNRSATLTDLAFPLDRITKVNLGLI